MNLLAVIFIVLSLSASYSSDESAYPSIVIQLNQSRSSATVGRATYILRRPLLDALTIDFLADEQPVLHLGVTKEGQSAIESYLSGLADGKLEIRIDDAVVCRIGKPNNWSKEMVMSISRRQYKLVWKALEDAFIVPGISEPLKTP